MNGALLSTSDAPAFWPRPSSGSSVSSSAPVGPLLPSTFDPRMPTRSDAVSAAARRPALAKHALPWYHVSLTDRVAAGRLDPPSSIRSPGAYASQAAEIMRPLGRQSRSGE